MMHKRKIFVVLLFAFFPLVILTNGCQYDYNSPLPGIVEVKLRTISNNIPFDPLNNFVLKVASVEAVRSDYARAQIYADVKAIGRTTTNYNTLDVRARDSSLVIGAGYLPPGDYISINLLITPGADVVLDGYRNIPVTLPDKFDPLLVFSRQFTIRENQTTNIVVTIDLDASLIQRSNDYLFVPKYYISSIH